MHNPKCAYAFLRWMSLRKSNAAYNVYHFGTIPTDLPSVCASHTGYIIMEIGIFKSPFTVLACCAEVISIMTRFPVDRAALFFYVKNQYINTQFLTHNAKFPF